MMPFTLASDEMNMVKLKKYLGSTDIPRSGTIISNMEGTEYATRKTQKIRETWMHDGPLRSAMPINFWKKVDIPAETYRM